MLTPEQREVLEAMIRHSLGGNPGTREVALFVGDEIADDMPIANRLNDLSDWMLRQAMRQPLPNILIRITRRVDTGDGKLSSIVDLADELEADPARWIQWARDRGVDRSIGGDPLHVEDGRPFIDRSAFRGIIPRESDTDSPTCILVEGHEGAGKTYLCEYCKCLASHWKNFKVGCTIVGSTNARNINPGTVAIELATGLQTDFARMPRAHEDPHRYARNLVAWITQFTPAKPLPSMMIFDGFDTPRIQDPVRTLIEGLIRSVQDDEQVRRRLRVLLLGYDRERLERKGLSFKPCVLEFVDTKHIEEWLRRRFPDQPDYRYEDTASEIESRLPPPGGVRLRELCNLVSVANATFQDAR